MDRARHALRRFALGAFVVGLAVSISLAEAALVALVVVLVWPSAERPRPGASHLSRGALSGWSRALNAPLLLPVAAFAAWTIVSALASARPLESVIAAKSLLTLGTLYVVRSTLPGARDARRIATLLFTLVSLVALLSIAQVAFCPAAPLAVPILGRFLRKCDRARGFYSIYMTLAGVLTLVLVSALPRVAQSARWIAFGTPAWLVGVLALALTSVRGAWLGFAAGAVGVMLGARRRAVTIVVLVVALVSLAVAWPGVMQRVRSIGDPRDETARDRLAMLHGGLGMAREHPWLGVGVGQVKHLYPLHAPPQALRRSTSHLHNTPLQILVERGAIGLALWLAIFGGFFARAIRTLGRLPADATEDRALVLGTIMALAAFLIAGLFEYNFGDTEVLLVACTLMALPFVIAHDLDRETLPGAPDQR